MWKQDLKTIGLLTAGLGAVGAAILDSRQDQHSHTFVPVAEPTVILDLLHEQRLDSIQKNPKILSMCPFREENEVKGLKEKPREKDVGALAEAKETAVDKTGNISESSEDKVDDLKVEELK